MTYLKLFGIATFAIGAILYLASAEDHNVVMGEQDYDLGEYSKISVNISAKLEVVSGEDYRLNVSASEEVLKTLKIYVKGQTLVLGNRGPAMDMGPDDHAEIAIHLPYLKKITINGSADADVKDVHGKIFKAIMNGTGNIEFDGESKTLILQINGSGDLSSTSFIAEESMVEINGSGDISLAGVCETLEVETNGSGNFYGADFKCEEVEASTVGSGDIDVFARDSLEVKAIGSGDVTAYGKPKNVTDYSDRKTHLVLK